MLSKKELLVPKWEVANVVMDDRVMCQGQAVTATIRSEVVDLCSERNSEVKVQRRMDQDQEPTHQLAS